jgi:hypothetical protein
MAFFIISGKWQDNTCCLYLFSEVHESRPSVQNLPSSAVSQAFLLRANLSDFAY